MARPPRPPPTLADSPMSRAFNPPPLPAGEAEPRQRSPGPSPGVGGPNEGFGVAPDAQNEGFGPGPNAPNEGFDPMGMGPGPGEGATTGMYGPGDGPMTMSGGPGPGDGGEFGPVEPMSMAAIGPSRRMSMPGGPRTGPPPMEDAMFGGPGGGVGNGGEGMSMLGGPVEGPMSGPGEAALPEEPQIESIGPGPQSRFSAAPEGMGESPLAEQGTAEPSPANRLVPPVSDGCVSKCKTIARHAKQCYYILCRAM